MKRRGWNLIWLLWGLSMGRQNEVKLLQLKILCIIFKKFVLKVSWITSFDYVELLKIAEDLCYSNIPKDVEIDVKVKKRSRRVRQQKIKIVEGMVFDLRCRIGV